MPHEVNSRELGLFSLGKRQICEVTATPPPPSIYSEDGARVIKVVSGEWLLNL